MDTITKFTLDLLTTDSVSVVTEKQIEIDGKIYTLETSRRAYVNSPLGRTNIIADLPEEYMTAIFALWGDIPTIEDPPMPEEIN